MKSHENTFPKNDENCHRFMPSFVVTCGVGISIDSHLLTFHCGEVSAAHPGIRISDEWRLPQIWCFSQYLPMGSFGKPGATLPSRIPPRYQAPMLRICRPPWGVSPAVMLVPQTSEVPGPRNSRCLRFFGTVFSPICPPFCIPLPHPRLAASKVENFERCTWPWTVARGVLQKPRKSGVLTHQNSPFALNLQKGDGWAWSTLLCPKILDDQEWTKII